MTAQSAVVSISARQNDVEALQERLLGSLIGAFDVFAVYLGDQLGFYSALREAGPLSSPELALRTGTHERYAREWLEHQATRGILTVDDARLPMTIRRYTLPPAHAEVLADAESLNFLAPIAQVFAGAVRPLDKLRQAYRSGDGVDYAEYGADLRAGQARINRGAFLHQLGQEWIPAMPDVDECLRGEDRRIADIGCGVGWSSIGMGRAYPKVRVDGFDTDVPSIAAARHLVAEEALGNRLSFHATEPDAEALAGQFDLVTALECVHDMSDPVGVMRAMRRIRKPGGAVMIMDERVESTFTGQGGDIEAMMYGWSMLHCLPVGMAEKPSAATGTVMRQPQLEHYARQAGFTSVEVLPIDNAFFRFYRLHG